MAEMVKKTNEMCLKCKYNYGHTPILGHDYVACKYLVITHQRRGCKWDECDKFEEGEPSNEEDMRPKM